MDFLFDNFEKIFPVVIVIALILAIVSGISVFNEWQNCNDHGGKMVKGISWNGYVCLDERR